MPAGGAMMCDDVIMTLGCGRPRGMGRKDESDHHWWHLNVWLCGARGGFMLHITHCDGQQFEWIYPSVCPSCLGLSSLVLLMLNHAHAHLDDARVVGVLFLAWIGCFGVPGVENSAASV